MQLLRCRKIFATAFSITTFFKNFYFVEDVVLCVRANAAFKTQCTVVFELVNYYRRSVADGIICEPSPQ